MKIEPRRAGKHAAPSLALLVGLLAWLWPFGVGGRMPVGGDVTQFQIGLMAVLSRAIRAGRLPLWNDLWGYGFPGVAESQMGVFYPPHLVLYGLCSVEAAYTLSLVIHTLWAGLGARWAARTMGTSPWGAALSGFAWATCGFFVIHFPHQWGYTSGSWMPWAWGLAWRLAREGPDRRTALMLAAVLAIQTLPGHFQLAFITQVGVLTLALWGLIERYKEWRRGLGRALAIALALAFAALLAAMQLWPTLRLARLAESRRDWEYLSGFAVAPLHFISYLAPGLFHRSPFWRPLAWDTFRTSPEEHLGYVGLVPLFLAAGAVRHGLRRDPAVRALAVLVGVSLVLSLGPNAPGFTTLIQFPGFSFFRAPARWGLATMLALALLAGQGFDGLATWPRPGRGLGRYVAMVLALIALVVVGLELEFPFHDPIATFAVPVLRDDRERAWIYAEELVPTGVLLLSLLSVTWLSIWTRRRAFAIGLLVVTLLDLGWHGRFKPVQTAPIRPLASQSPVLARLAREPRGTRVLQSGISNLPMSVGAATLSHYRTLDLPALEATTLKARQYWFGHESLFYDAARVMGTGVRLFGAVETQQYQRVKPFLTVPGRVETLDDPKLAAWMRDPLEPTVVARRTTFALWWPETPPTHAWLVAPVALTRLATDTGSRGWPPQFLSAASPLIANWPVPERVEVVVGVGEAPAVVVLSQLAYPEWRARWRGPGGERPATIRRVFGGPVAGGWQAVDVPGPGVWTLQLDYEGHDVRHGLIVSALAWTLWTVALAWPWPRRRALPP